MRKRASDGMFAVKETSVSSADMRSLSSGGTVWWSSLERAKEVAAAMAPLSLAHRMFIVQPGQNGSKLTVVEEVHMPPLVERVCMVHLMTLMARDPQRFEAESQGVRWTAPAMAKDKLAVCLQRLGLSAAAEKAPR